MADKYYKENDSILSLEGSFTQRNPGETTSRLLFNGICSNSGNYSMYFHHSIIRYPFNYKYSNNGIFHNSILNNIIYIFISKWIRFEDGFNHNSVSSLFISP